ncbi:site-specific integrase [Pseudoprimorskyibacter insulae]|uniref:Core-binding (CB) domain-containing protein n=1 Tax=Pseudoprimorskyibacter insulae TaxID=1695997 RepID=A0A2R8AU61_9RHOB|nr:integrase [Pseudoprimorskyibacter insulae]SPF79583.1 hypothetical protein PRI8871_01380 [Pseudoprimorskyibacter insulae]
MRNLTVKYLKLDAVRNKYFYRRRVPAALVTMIGRAEFNRVLGRTFQESITLYGQYHQEIEHIVQLAKVGVTSKSPAEEQKALVAFLKVWGADPHSKGRDDNEHTWRSFVADRMLDPYQDSDTGEFLNVPAEVGAVAGALLEGVPVELPEPTITDAFKVYLEENAKPIPEQRKKQEARFRRSERNLIGVIGRDKLVSELTRQDARAWRDRRLQQGVSPSTVTRERNDISAVISFAISELDAGGENPFKGVKMPKKVTSRQKEREALPDDVIRSMYETLKAKPDLWQIWTLLDHTGARPSEIRMLRRNEIVLDDPIPHLVIQLHEDRTLKTTWSERKIPLVGLALKAAQDAHSGPHRGEFAFQRYASAGGMDRLSSALQSRLRRFTKDTKHTAYSLRHNMKNRMRAAEIFPETAKSIEGHSYGAGQDASYGGERSGMHWSRRWHPIRREVAAKITTKD